ncbi:uncharacterized protein TM35_000052970 [Trypanosoma theileri]|uniref:Uncharacterized protein n=1 Tax=Trypanosoma theileri TaxID=67003 RepID=A0A1X0P4E2_9TRYP|nr:uncharacterized protein TM35_000052970 [Trypanosoma theileri]ORC91701.1 hypothetical protein TM35_000052970 [Trypanosoma theileri]
MSESPFTDADAEDLVVFVSFQTLLSTEAESPVENTKRYVPVEGHYAVVAYPWCGGEKCQLLYNKGFVHSPNTNLFPQTDKCDREWIQRVKARHGIAPQRSYDSIVRKDVKDLVRRSRRYLVNAQNTGDASLMLVENEKEHLQFQIEDVLSAVENFYRLTDSTQRERTLIFITTNDRLKMVRAVFKWFSEIGTRFPPYAVVAMEEFIPATGELLSETDNVRHLDHNRCAVHPASSLNCFLRPYDCCRADVSTLLLVRRYLAEYLAE